MLDSVQDWFDSHRMGKMAQLDALVKECGVTYKIDGNVVSFTNVDSKHHLAILLDGVTLELGTWKLVTQPTISIKRSPPLREYPMKRLQDKDETN